MPKTNIVRFRRKPTELVPLENPYLPSKAEYEKWTLPEELALDTLKDIAGSIQLLRLGVTIPSCRYPNRYEAGFRFGLSTSGRTNINEHFRPLFSAGFCAAKLFYHKFDPTHPLGVPQGSMKLTARFVE